MSTSSSYPVILGQISSNITLYVDYITLILGTIGGICNLITYSGRQMRQTSSVIYLLYATVFQILSVLFSVPLRLTVDRSPVNLFNQSSVFCKLRLYFVITLPALASYYMFLAIFDRCLSTSKNIRIRSWCNTKVAYRLSFGTMIIMFLISIHILIFYDIYNNLCLIIPGSIYTFIFAGYLTIIVTFLPHALMFVFSLITIFNIRKTRRSVVPSTTVNPVSNHRQASRIELQIIKIIIIQVFLGILLTLLRLGSYSHNIIVNAFLNPTVDARAAAAFAVTLGGSLYFFSFGIPFYVSIISSKFFRNEFYERILFIHRWCVRH